MRLDVRLVPSRDAANELRTVRTNYSSQSPFCACDTKFALSSPPSARFQFNQHREVGTRGPHFQLLATYPVLEPSTIRPDVADRRCQLRG